MTRDEWIAAVKTYLSDLCRQEENAWMQRGRKRCPYCGTKDRDDDDGSWIHEEECPFDRAHSLYMTSPMEAAD